MNEHQGSGIRLAELVAALSLATDLARGRPLEQGLGVCVLAVELGEAAGLDEDELTRVWYLALLRHIGCTADNHLLAELVGDEIAFSASLAGIDATSPEAVVAHLAGHLARTAGPAAAASLADQPATTHGLRETAAAVCEVAELLAERSGGGRGRAGAEGRRRQRVAGLTAREVEVLGLLAGGRSNREIAAALTIAPKTADAHVQHIYAKIGVTTRATAAVFAMRHDLIGGTGT